MLRKLKFILFLAFAGSLSPSWAQSGLKRIINVASGTYNLTELLEKINREGRLAYSSSLFQNKFVTVNGNQLVGQLLSELYEKKIIDFTEENDQIVITPYVRKLFTLNGIIKDAESGEQLIGTSIQVSGTTTGTTSNGYGFYSLTLPEGSYEIFVSHVGYVTKKTHIELKQHTHFTVHIRPEIIELESIEINSLAQDINISESIPSINRIRLNAKGQIPYFLGEVDVIQNALLLPGIKTIGEDASGLHIRGGSVDQNLILLDEATIYNPNHFYGLISVFNPEAVNDVRVLKGFIPPSYGGRVSSVIEIRQKEGNTKKLSYSGGIGLLSARGLIEGPFRKGESSFLVAVRQSLLNLSIDDFRSTSVRRNRIRFQDINVKINSRPNAYNTFYWSGYFGNDRNTVGLNSVRKWGNRTANFRWNHLFSPRLFSNVSAFVSQYSYRIDSPDEPGAFVARSRIVDYSLKADLIYSLNPANELAFGLNTTFHRLKPGERKPLDKKANTNLIELDVERGFESALYLSHKTELEPVDLNYGLRFSTLHNVGSGRVFIYKEGQPREDSTIIDTRIFQKNELIKLHQHVEPRIAVNWKINKTTALKTAYSKTVQYLHLISNTVTPAPTDIWKLSNTYIPPTISHHYTIGLYKNLRENKWEANTEVYYKDIRNDLAYENGADLIFNENIETEILLGRGRSYGVEFYLSKKYGKLTGWVSYTLSRSETRLVENEIASFVLNNFDKTHDFSTTWVMPLSPRLSASANFIYSTGIPVTLPSGKYLFENNLIPHFGDRNKSRLPDYHRLDLSLKWKGKRFNKKGAIRKNQNYWIFTFYNVYARKNANSYFYRQSTANPGLAEIVQYSIFGTIIPAVTYNFKF